MARGRLHLLAGAALLVAGSGIAGARDRLPPFPRGLYGNVTYGEESGDLGGFEVRFYLDPATGRQMAELTLCEGWCNEAHTAEVTRDGDGFVFSHTEVLTAYDGDKPVSREEHRASYRVVPAGRHLDVFHAYDGQPLNADAPWRIKPLRRAYGLEVARREMGKTQP